MLSQISLSDVTKIYSRSPLDHFLRVSGPAQKAIDGGRRGGGGAEICTISDNRSLSRRVLPPFQTGGRRPHSRLWSGRGRRGSECYVLRNPLLRRRSPSVRSRWAMGAECILGHPKMDRTRSRARNF